MSGLAQTSIYLVVVVPCIPFKYKSTHLGTDLHSIWLFCNLSVFAIASIRLHIISKSDEGLGIRNYKNIHRHPRQFDHHQSWRPNCGGLKDGNIYQLFNKYTCIC